MIQLVPVLLWWVLLGVPLYFILKRTGMSQGLIALVLIPLIGAVIVLWILAFARWPRDSAPAG
jgi:hypothetical protein